MPKEGEVLRSSNIPNKYELIIVASKEARRLNELSRQTGLNLGAKVTNVSLEEALKGNVLYTYAKDESEIEPDSTPGPGETTEE